MKEISLNILDIAKNSTKARASLTTITINETEDTLVTNVKKATMNKGTYLDLECGLLGDETVSWTSSKTSVATISKDGTVFAKKKGTVTISAKTDMGRTAKVKITIE